ncbi:protein Eaa [Salmonella enterica]|nr:protein Eaa [Salmonella enterica]
MTTITREQLIEKLQNRIAVTANYPGVEEAQLDAAIFKIALASLEAKPIGAFHIADQQVDGTTDYIKNGEWPIDNGVIDVYAAPPAPVDNEFIPKNLDKALGVVGVALPESKDEFNFQIERWIQRLIDRDIRYADEFKEQPTPVVPDERAAFNAWNNEDNLPSAGVGAKNAAWLAWQARASLCGNSALNVPPERPADSSNGDDIEAWFDEGWNACRAAMLQGDKS